jgi:hypothetical protein
MLLTNFLIAQNLDSLYNAILSIESQNMYSKAGEEISSNAEYGKCGFSIVGDAKLHFDEFTFEQQNIIQNILARPERDTSIVSPAGIFRIHYDTVGTSAPDYFDGVTNTIQLSIDSLAIAFDSSYNYEINYLGYTPPPSDEGAGGDNLFDIYITRLGYYGVTDWEANSSNQNMSYIRVDNKMNFYTKGINAARATAAHEFHHAIQVGNYSDYLDGNTFYFEVTSTSMEEFVFDEVNDYYGYLSGYFNNSDRRFTYFDGTGNGGGYDRAIWNIFLKEKFEQEDNNPKKGLDLIKRSWELMRNNKYSAMESINLALSESGLSLKNMFAEFSQWTYFTNHRTEPNKYFSEASKYPLIKPLVKYQYEPPKKTYILNSEPMSNSFLFFDLSYSGINDSLYSIITNCDINNADEYPYQKANYEYSLLTNAEDGTNEIVTGYYSVLESDNMEFLKESNIFNNVVVNGTVVSRNEIDFAYPQPFRYANNSYVFFPTKLNQTGIAKLAIYSTSMELVYNDNLEIYNAENIVVRWDGKSNSGANVPSGIYIYVTESDGKVVTGKIAIINN